MADVVRYHNKMNSMAFGKFKEKELDLFFSICFKLKEQETKEITLSFTELKKLSSYENRNLDRFIRDLESTYDKMLSLNIKIAEDSRNFEKIPLFGKYKISDKEKFVSIQINEEFRYLLNELTGNYTKFELMDFVNLRSVYSKNVFKLLKQWHSVGELDIEMKEFKRLLDIPEKYRMSEIDKKVLTPIMKELPQHFLNLKLEKIKSGKNVSNLRFTWAKGITVITEKSEEPKVKSKLEVPHGEQLNIFQDKIIKKAEIELTDEEQERRKENIKKQFNSLKNNFQSEQKTEIKEEIIPVIIEEKEKESEQNNLNLVPGGGVAPGEKTYPQEIWDKVKEYDSHIGYLEAVIDNFDIGIEEALDILRAEFYWKESQKKIEEYKILKRQERIEKKQSTLERDFSHGEGSSRFIGYKTIEDLERFCFTGNKINSTGVSLAEDLIELHDLHDDILSKTGKELKGTARLFKLTKIIRNYGVK